MMEIKLNDLSPKKTLWLVILVLLLAIGGFIGIRSYNQQYLPVDPANQKPIDVYIPADSSARQVASILHEHQLIRSQNTFLSYCSKEKLDTRLKPGHYSFNQSLSLAEIAQRIAAGQVIKIKITIPEGYTVNEIGAMLSEKQLCTQEAWQKAVQANYPYDFLNKVPSEAKQKLEGFLFPDTYYIEKGASSQDIVEIMLQNFASIWDKEFAQQAKAKNMDVFETIILASLIEEEAMHDDERVTISGVIKNRLQKGMYLQLCPTVLYCIDEKKTELSNADLDIESPYNTYRNPGLPPGPIANPGKASIAAALNPEENEYFFYVAKGNGTHYFSRTFDEHLQAMARYQ
ncbi:MAG: endolytic transglycosylase MltG [Syntrophomonadaceae bacterium]|jgi:UPF0755 protein